MFVLTFLFRTYWCYCHLLNVAFGDKDKQFESVAKNPNAPSKSRTRIAFKYKQKINHRAKWNFMSCCRNIWSSNINNNKRISMLMNVRKWKWQRSENSITWQMEYDHRVPTRYKLSSYIQTPRIHTHTPCHPYVSSYKIGNFIGTYTLISVPSVRSCYCAVFTALKTIITFQLVFHLFFFFNHEKIIWICQYDSVLDVCVWA